MLHVTNLTVTYKGAGDAVVLGDITFSLRLGERLALIGANGAGKSTLLLSLIGIMTPKAGEIIAGDIPVTQERLRDLRQLVGMVFQNPDDQLFMPTVLEDIAFGLRNYGFDEKTIEARIDAMLGRLGIAHLKNRMSHRLSGGEKRLVALAGVLVMEPSLLLMDEPSSFLDPRARRTLITILDDLPQTMVIATHDLDLALTLCRRTILLKQGRIFADGPVGELLDDPVLLEQCGL
ncbi:MAG: energy-coupling factor ABC transporter ATP-binding protein [Treponema sp.]|nr:energy-coupling factor ABC transporter ATP-binding protein [Treponema sp.]